MQSNVCERRMPLVTYTPLEKQGLLGEELRPLVARHSEWKGWSGGRLQGNKQKDGNEQKCRGRLQGDKRKDGNKRKCRGRLQGEKRKDGMGAPARLEHSRQSNSTPLRNTGCVPSHVHKRPVKGALKTFFHVCAPVPRGLGLKAFRLTSTALAQSRAILCTTPRFKIAMVPAVTASMKVQCIMLMRVTCAAVCLQGAWPNVFCSRAHICWCLPAEGLRVSRCNPWGVTSFLENPVMWGWLALDLAYWCPVLPGSCHVGLAGAGSSLQGHRHRLCSRHPCCVHPGPGFIETLNGNLARVILEMPSGLLYSNTLLLMSIVCSLKS
eukprot:118789-Pelagomonas_calceolata.AAC.1